MIYANDEVWCVVSTSLRFIELSKLKVAKGATK